MEPDSEVQSIFRLKDGADDEDQARWARPPSSYGSMKSDREEMEDEPEEETEDRCETVAAAAVALSAIPATHGETRLQLIRSDSPETVFTTTTQRSEPPTGVVLPTWWRPVPPASPQTIRTVTTEQSGPPAGIVIPTRCFAGDEEEEEEEEEENYRFFNSPEPPEFVEPDDMTDERQTDGLHPECDLPHIFRSLQGVLSALSIEELYIVKMSFHRVDPRITQEQRMEGDVLDFVDVAIGFLGQDQTLRHTLRFLEANKKMEKADELRNLCKRALTRLSLREDLIRKHEIIREGVVRAGCQHYLDAIYVEPEICTCDCGGADPSPGHQTLDADGFVGVNNLFRLQKDDGTPVRTVVTTGLPGIGMSVSVAKFSLDWAQERFNKDLQFVIKLSFRKWWLFQTRTGLLGSEFSVMDAIEYLYPDCKGTTYLDEEGCKFLVVMDSFDCYRAPLDWENTPEIHDSHAKARPEVLIVNIIRGTLLPGACKWILGRRAAVSQIPSEFVDAFTVIRGFRDEMKDEFLTKRAKRPQQAQEIVAQFRRLPALVALARQPFVCWMVSTVFERCFKCPNYGNRPPRITPFYVNVMIVQMNRRLQFYYGQPQNSLGWSDRDKDLLRQMGKMSLRMLERDVTVFSENEVAQCGLQLTEVTVLSGMCTELPAAAASHGQRRFCFLSSTFQEFLAALYVFHVFRIESRNVLDSGYVERCKAFVAPASQPRKPLRLVECALNQTLSAPLGRYDMFLRFLCGLLNVDCHEQQLDYFLYHRKDPKVLGLDEVEQLLRQTVQTAPEERRENLEECLREMTQKEL